MARDACGEAKTHTPFLTPHSHARLRAATPPAKREAHTHTHRGEASALLLRTHKKMLLPSPAAAASARRPGVASASAAPAPLARPARARQAGRAPHPSAAGGCPGRRTTPRTVARAGDDAEGGGGLPAGTAGDKLGGDGQKMADTLSALDALLGVEPEPPKKEETTVSVSC